jgi:uncharacterized protein YqjF (DUF2071 family)
MTGERPFLTASWTELVMLNFEVPGDVIAELCPPGTEPDYFEGKAYASVVGFMFRDARFFGLGLPWHRQFEEVNLRYYVRREAGNTVRREAGDTVRRGVVFVREIAPRPLVAATARWLYNESYVTRWMRHDLQRSGGALAAGDRVQYEWRTGCGERRRWNRMAARAAATPRLPDRGSLSEFIAEHYWAYVHTRDGGTAEYRVAHRPWRVAPAEDVMWDCDLAMTYEHTPLWKFLKGAPALAFVADGSPVQVFPGARIKLPAGPALRTAFETATASGFEPVSATRPELAPLGEAGRARRPAGAAPVSSGSSRE